MKKAKAPSKPRVPKALKPKAHKKPSPWAKTTIATHGVTVTSATPDQDKSKEVQESTPDAEESGK